MKANKKRRFESGQAITEMVVSLMAIMTVFIGLLFVSALGVENVKNMIEGRSQAETYAANGINGESGEAIRYWEYGDDELPFTADDEAVHGSIENPDYVMGQLQTNQGFSSADLDGSYVHNNFATAFALPLFVKAANLAEYEAVNESPIEERNLGDMVAAYKALIQKNPDFTLREKVFIATPSSGK